MPLSATADPPGVLDAASWVHELLGTLAPAALDCLDVGAEDARADWAASGAVLLTGRHDGPPLVPPGGAATAARVAGQAFAALTASVGRPVVVSGHLLLGERAALLGLQRRGPWSAGGSCRAVRSSDGWFALNLARPDDLLSLPALLEREDIERHPRGAWNAIDHWAPDVSAKEAVDRAQSLGIPAGVIRSPSEVAPPTPLIVHRLAEGSQASVQLRPLVIDLSALWAGPLCSHLLGLAGARIIKVESSDRLDGGRRGPAAFYDLLHGEHESVLLDLRSATGRRDLLSLLRAADIVVDSSRPRAMEQLGVDVEGLCRETATTWVSITAYGRSGHWSNRVGFGDDVAMAAGVVAYDPDREGEPIPLPCADALADPLAGLHAAVVALAAHLRGGGRLVEVSMYRLAAATLGLGEAVSGPAAWTPRGWGVQTSDGVRPVAPPTSRLATTRAAPPGMHTEAILGELPGP